MEKRLTADLNVVSNSNLEIQLLDGDLNIIQKLDDEPNDVGGLTSAELKAKFDESGNIIKKYINETLIPSVLTDDAIEESRKQAEAARVAAEQGRVTAEEGRVSAETARAQAEASRTSAETARGNAESQRASAETTRVDNETARNQGETARVAAENARANAETARGQAEQNRAQSETARDQAETARRNSENIRATSEAGRVQAEQNRASAEQSRTSAEAAREAAEKARADETSGIVARATAQANAAAAAQSAAETAESGAKDSATAAAQSAQMAQGAASTAANAASSASQSATAAFGSASQAQASAAAAAQSAASVDGINKTAQSWAVGGTGTREGEDTNNAKYWAKQAEAIAGGDFAQPSDTTPKAPGTAAVGTETKYARGDHVHPSDPTKQGINDEIQALRLRGGLVSIGSLMESVAINPAVNGVGFARLAGAIVKIYYGSYEMPIDNYSIDSLFDGKFGTYINFSQPSGNFAWENSKTYPVGAYVTNGGYWYKALKENTNVTPAGDTTGAWELASRSQAGSYINLDNVPVSIDITFPFSIRYENSLALYWRSTQQNASYLKVEKYDSNLEWFQVYEKSSIDGGDIVNNIWLSRDPSGGGTQKRLRITFKALPGVTWCALTQISVTGVVGSIEGTLLNRGGGTMFGNLSPYTAGGASLGTSSAPWKEVRAKALYGNVSDTTSSFSVASARGNIASGEKLSILFGKIAKWFADLKSLAFKDTVSKSDLDSSVQAMLDAGEVKMRKVTLTVAGWDSNTKQQTVAVSGILADGTKQKVICSPVDESYDSVWNSCYVQCVGHGADSLTFQCDEIPTIVVDVFVSIQPVSFAS